MKRIILLLTALLAPFMTNAQVSIKDYLEAPSKRQLQQEKLRLQYELDSIKAVVADLYQLLDNYTLPDPEEENIVEQIEYTADVADSILSEMYENRRVVDYVDGQSYDLDSVLFPSKTSDEELMKRLKAMNSYISLPFNPTVRNYIVQYSEKMPEKMGVVLGLAQYYMPIFEEVFDRYGLPLELKYMAVIESMLRATAESRAGAKGMWQFMYRTGKLYGLTITSYVDERMDVEKAVDAAARYLRDSYNAFGDWTLAISSYNCGTGNVRKAIRRAGGKMDFWSIYPYLPRETRGYMPAFVGAMYAMTYYRDYGIVPQPCPIPVEVDTFVINQNLHFQQVSEVIGVPVEKLRELNPQYIRDIVPGNEASYVLKLPFNYSNSFIDIGVDSLVRYKADTLFTEQVVKSIKTSTTASDRIAYKVKKGDVLGKIATKYHVSVKNIQKWNHLKSTTIRVGQILYIYPN